jgi:anthranilate phosphoribosyltransferase
MREMLDLLLDRVDLSEEQAEILVRSLASAEVDPAMAGAVLAALRAKGETPAEVRGFARAMRELATDPGIDAAGAVDVVGTGGDGSGSLNLSTGAALLTAAAGVPVVKHGNRSMTSRSGAADVLEVLGLPVPLESAQAARLFDQTGFTFLFAPHYHPAIAAVGPIRKALGVRTVFNMLGPLTNPSRPRHMVVGAFHLEAARLMAGALAGLEVERVFVVHGAEGWDEPTPVGEFHLFEVIPGLVTQTVRQPGDYGLNQCLPGDLRGGSPQDNARSLLAVFDGEPGPHRDAIVLGAALALEVIGAAAGPGEAVGRAAAAIDDGSALKLVECLGRFGKEAA